MQATWDDVLERIVKLMDAVDAFERAADKRDARLAALEDRLTRLVGPDTAAARVDREAQYARMDANLDEIETTINNRRRGRGSRR